MGDESGTLLPFEPSEYAGCLLLLRCRMEAARLDEVICVSPAASSRVVRRPNGRL
jgi:hypothetical protein